MARRAHVSAAQLRELDGAWETVSTELSAAIAFAVSQRPKDLMAAIVEHLSRHLPAGSTAALQAEIVGLRAQVKELTLENEQLKHEPSGHAVPGEECGVKLDEPELKASLERTGATDWSDKRVGHLLGALDVNGDGVVDRSELETTCRQLGDVLAALAGPAEEAAASPALQALRDKTQAVLAKLEAAKPSTAAAGPTSSLPDGLKDFTPLAKEPEIEKIAAGLHELELAVVRNPTSEAALAALRAETGKLALATQAKVDERTAEARRAPPTAEELEAMWAELIPRVREKMKEGFAGYYMLDEEKAERVQKMVDKLQAAWEKASVDDKPRLLREAKKEHLQEGESFVPLISECAAAILAGNRDFQKIYNAVYDVVRSGEADSMEAAQAAIAALGKAVRGDPKLLQQRDEAAETVTLLADAAGARPAFAELVRCLSEATGARCVSK